MNGGMGWERLGGEPSSGRRGTHLETKGCRGRGSLGYGRHPKRKQGLGGVGGGSYGLDAARRIVTQSEGVGGWTRGRKITCRARASVELELAKTKGQAKWNIGTCSLLVHHGLVMSAVTGYGGASRENKTKSP